LQAGDYENGNVGKRRVSRLTQFMHATLQLFARATALTTYTQTYIHTHIHTYIHTYIHTDIHTYIDTYHITALHTELDTVRWASKKLLEN